MKRYLILLLAGLFVQSPELAEARDRFCSKTASAAQLSCKSSAKEDYALAKGNCINVADKGTRKTCEQTAKSDYREAREECRDQFNARKDLCGRIGEARYSPDFRAANFVDPNDIGTSVTPNQFFPLVVGNRWVYQGGDEEVTVIVTNKTKLVNGVTCRVVTDSVKENGVDHEITDDWFAQDLNGNVWYCGEISSEYEVFSGDAPAEPELVGIEGSWKAGREGAQPGIIMLANPVPGAVYREEMFLGEAEDAAEVISTTGSETSPESSCSGNCLVTHNFTPLEPDASEMKYYAPGVGLILEIGASGDRVELVEFANP